MGANEMDEMTVIECDFTQKLPEAHDEGPWGLVKIVANTLDALLSGLLERTKIHGPRIVFCPPPLGDLLKGNRFVCDVGRKHSKHALQQEFVEKERSSAARALGVAFLQDAQFQEIPRQQKKKNTKGQSETGVEENETYWGVKNAAGVSKGIHSMFDAQTMLARRPYLVLLDQERFNELMPRAHGRVAFDSRMSKLRDEYLGDSSIICEIREQILAAARDSRCTVLILGESGTGKSEIAEIIHKYTVYDDRGNGEGGTTGPDEHRKCLDSESGLVHVMPVRSSHTRRTSPRFVLVNCAAISPKLFEGIMFGTKKGIASGVELNRGEFVRANGGTLFLDEVGDIDPSHQSKFLTVLRTKEVSPVGHDGDPIKLKQRIIFATKTDLHSDLRNEKLREDLYYRLNESDFTIRTVPLREHPEDIPLISERYWETCDETGTNKQKTKTVSATPKLPSEVLEELKKFAWPGNVSQLQGVLKKLRNMIGQGAKKPILELLLSIIAMEAIPLSERMMLRYTTGLMEQASEELESLSKAIPVESPESPSDLGESLGKAIHLAFDHVKHLRASASIRAQDELFRRLRAMEGDLEDAIRFLDTRGTVRAVRWPTTLKHNLAEIVPDLLEACRLLRQASYQRDLRSDVAIGTDLLALREILAKVNHDIWMDMRRAEKWRYGKERNDKEKTHPDLVHYDALSEGEKQYDRNMAIGTIRALHHLGYRIIKEQGKGSGKEQ